MRKEVIVWRGACQGRNERVKSGVSLLGKNNMRNRPQTTAGMTHHTLSNLKAFCSLFCYLVLNFSQSLPLHSVAILLSYPLTVIYPLGFLAAGSLPMLRSYVPHSVAHLAFNSLSEMACSPPALLSWLPSLFSS